MGANFGFKPSYGFFLCGLGGILLSRAVSFFFPLRICCLELYQPHLGIAFLPLLTIHNLFTGGKRSWTIPMAIGFVFDGFLFLIIRVDHRYWDPASFFSSLFFLLFFTILASCRRPSDRVPAGPLDRTRLWAFSLSALLTLGAYRILNYAWLLGGIPNEQRSIFIMGYEIHHICYGVLVCALLLVLKWNQPFPRAPYLWESGILGFAVASIADQLVYYMFPVQSDQAYFSAASWSSGMIATSLYLAFPVFILNRRHKS